MPKEAVRTKSAAAVGSPVDWARYRDNLPRHLIGIARDLQFEVMSSLVQEQGFPSLRMSFGPIVALLAASGERGRPLGVLARELATTKQACSQLADTLEAAGYLTRRPNPLDGRSKMLVLTEQGMKLADAGGRLIAEREKVYRAAVGARKWTAWLKALRALYVDLNFPTDAGPTPSVAVLPLVVDRIQQRLMEGTMAKGHPELKRSYAQILLLIGPEGGRVSEMAQIQNVSRQAISAVSLELEGLGYLMRVPDPRDGRGRVLALSGGGERLIADSVTTVSEMGSGFRERVGEEHVDLLEGVACDLYHALGLEEAVFARSDSK